jgi:serine/threonine protein kinase
MLDDNDQLQIVDFGVASMIEGNDDILNNTVGSRMFFAPELCSGG